MDIVYGPWFGALISRSSNPLLMRRVVLALGVPASAKGLQVVAALALRAATVVAEGSSHLEGWREGFAELSKQCSSLQLEHATLRELGHVSVERNRAYAALVRIAGRGTQISSSALHALGCELLCAAGSSRVANGHTLDLIAALANSDRLQVGSDWLAFEALHPLSYDGLREAMDAMRLSGQAQLLGRRLARLINALTKPATLPIEGQKPTRNTNGEEHGSRQPGSAPKQSKKVKTHKPRPPAEPPSFARLSTSALYLSALDHLGVPEVWHRYRLSELQRVTRQLATDICAVASPERARLAAFCVLALLINHDHRSTVKLSLLDNDDLWLSVQDGVLVVKVTSRRRKRKKKTQRPPTGAVPSAERSNLVYIVVPECLSAYLLREQTPVPNATTLGELLGIEDADAWARRCEAYLAPLGDPAHPARPGRVSHSLGLAYLEMGASPELAAALGVAPCLCADSSLDYMCFEFTEARQMSARVYEALGLGPAAETRDFGRMGSVRALTDGEVRAVWTSLDANFHAALTDIECATDVKAVAEAYTKGSSAAYLAFTWCVAGRGQRTDRPTHADVRTHQRFVYCDDKDTEPTGERLVARLRLLNTVVAAQLALSAATAKALQRLGVRPEGIPTALFQPTGFDHVFGRLTVNRTGNEVDWFTLSGGDVASAVAACGCRHRNAARHTWASAIHSAGPGLWAVRTLLGHGRGAATPGSLLGTWAPHDLLADLGRRMDLVVKHWGLKDFGGQDGATEPLLLPVAVALQRFDYRHGKKRPRGKPPLFRHLPRHYCSQTAVHALRAVDELRAELHTVNAFGQSGAVLLSLLSMDGLLDPADLRSVWEVLRVESITPSCDLHWTRQTGQIIRMPMHPATQLLVLEALRPEPAKNAQPTDYGTELAGQPTQAEADAPGLPTIDVAAAQVVERLQCKFPLSLWPTTTEGVLEALSWLMCHWARVHLPPLLVYCYDAFTKAATYTELSYRRIAEPFDPSNISEDLLERAVAERSGRRSLNAELELLTKTVNGIAKDDSDIGDDLARSQKIKDLLDERFDRSECSAFALLLLEWLDLEFDRWQQRQPDPLQMSPLAEYLRLIARSVGTDIGELAPAYWTEDEWKRFAEFALNVDKPEEEGQVGIARAPGEIAERRKAWRRLVKVLNQADRYGEAASAFGGNDASPKPTRMPKSASSSYCSSEHLAAGEALLRELFADDPFEADVLVLAMRAGYEGMGRANECNAVRAKDVGADFLSLFGEFFSTEKTDGSRRCPPTSEEFTELLKCVVAHLRTLRPPATHLFSARDGTVRLRYGQARQAVIVAVMRAVLCDPDFVWHTFRSIGMRLRLMPKTEPAVRGFLAGGRGLEHARTLMAALRGADPRHLGRVFGCSGHASQVSPGKSYLPAWPIWYAAAMRAAGEHHPISPRLLLQMSDARHAAKHRKRRQRADEMDEWSMALDTADRRKERRAHIVPADVTKLQTAELPSWLSELARLEPVGWQTRLRFGVEVLFGLEQPPRAWRAQIDGPTADALVAALQPIPPLEELHHPTPHRANGKSRQRFSAVDLLTDDRALQLLTALETASQESVRALDELLSDSLLSFEPELVRRALAAIPLKWKLELCWPRGKLDMGLVTRLAPLKSRLLGLQRRVHVRGGVRTRVVPAVAANNTVNTSMTTLARAACRVWIRMCDQKGS